MIKRTIALLLLIFLASIFANASPSDKVKFELTLLHHDDAESQLINAGAGFEDFGGVARFATLVDRLRKDALSRNGNAKRGVLFLSNGDSIFPGVQLNAGLQKGVPFYESIAIDILRYDVLSLGNHDFDLGPDVLADFLIGFKHTIPVVAANLDFSEEPVLQSLVNSGKLARSAVVNIHGEKIGVIGAITTRLSFVSSPRNVIVDSDVVSAVQQEVDALEDSGVNIIILLTHLEDLDQEIELVESLRGVDIVVAAAANRTTEVQANAGDLLIPGDTIVAPYPIFVEDVDGNNVPLVSSTRRYRYIGQLVARFDKSGNLLEIDESNSHVFRVAGGNQTDAVIADRKVQARIVDPVQDAVDALASNIIAESEVDLDGVTSNLRTRETNEGNLVADSCFFEATRLAPSFGAPAPDVAIVNAGGIRNNSLIPAGDITELDTFNIVPFANFLAIVPSIPPSQFKEILENAVSLVDSFDGRFAQISGFQFTWDPTGTAQVVDEDGNVVTPGTRIRDVELNDATTIVSNGVVVNGAPSLNVATIDFLARSGDEFPFRGAPFVILSETQQQVLYNYLVNTLNGLIEYADYPEGGEGRITNVGS